MGSAALKLTWRNYSALELEATCVVWSLETLAYYLKVCPAFDLWSDHSPPAQDRIRILFVKGVHNHISDGLSRSP